MNLHWGIPAVTFQVWELETSVSRLLLYQQLLLNTCRHQGVFNSSCWKSERCRCRQLVGWLKPSRYLPLGSPVTTSPCWLLCVAATPLISCSLLRRDGVSGRLLAGVHTSLVTATGPTFGDCPEEAEDQRNTQIRTRQKQNRDVFFPRGCWWGHSGWCASSLEYLTLCLPSELSWCNTGAESVLSLKRKVSAIQTLCCVKPVPL